MEEMSRRSNLGEFHLMVMLVVIQLGEEAYGVLVSREIENHIKRSVSMGRVYASLERLEAMGLLCSRMGEPTQERGGRAKQYFRATKEGLRMVRETRRILTNLWRRIPDFEGDAA